MQKGRVQLTICYKSSLGFISELIFSCPAKIGYRFFEGKAFLFNGSVAGWNSLVNKKDRC